MSSISKSLNDNIWLNFGSSHRLKVMRHITPELWIELNTNIKEQLETEFYIDLMTTINQMIDHE